MPRGKKFAAHLAYSFIVLVAVLIVVIADKSGLAARQVTPSGGVPKTGIAITHRSPSGRESAVRTLYLFRLLGRGREHGLQIRGQALGYPGTKPVHARSGFYV